MPRRLLRFALHLVTLLSLLLCLAAAALWVRSYSVSDEIASTHFARDGDVFYRRGVTFLAGEGALACTYFSATDEMRRADAAQMAEYFERAGAGGTGWLTYEPPRRLFLDGLMLPWTPPTAQPASTWNRLGFYGHFSRGPTPALPAGVPGGRAVRDFYTNAHALVPLWFVVAITAVLPVWWVLALWRRERLVLAGRCPSCGYDTRATPGVCPECGRDPATAQPPRLLLHSRAVSGAFRWASNASAAVCAGAAALCLFAAAVTGLSPPRGGVAALMFNLDTYLPGLPALSLVTLLLVTALPPAARLAFSARNGSLIRIEAGSHPSQAPRKRGG